MVSPRFNLAAKYKRNDTRIKIQLGFNPFLGMAAVRFFYIFRQLDIAFVSEC
jgi:hypothetical protein